MPSFQGRYKTISREQSGRRTVSHPVILDSDSHIFYIMPWMSHHPAPVQECTVTDQIPVNWATTEREILLN
jgi:hypothetical protein